MIWEFKEKESRNCSNATFFLNVFFDVLCSPVRSQQSHPPSLIRALPPSLLCLTAVRAEKKGWLEERKWEKREEGEGKDCHR